MQSTALSQVTTKSSLLSGMMVVGAATLSVDRSGASRGAMTNSAGPHSYVNSHANISLSMSFLTLCLAYMQLIFRRTSVPEAPGNHEISLLPRPTRDQLSDTRT
jgi:hypothetical protein